MVGIAFRLRSAVIFEIHRVDMIFFLQLLALICLCVTPGQAASNSVMGDDHILGHPPTLDLQAQSGYPAFDEDPLGDGKKAEEKKETVEPVTRKIPIWGEKLREMGYDLPLPFGVGANFTLMDQGIDIRNVKVGFGEPIFEISDLTFSDARAHDAAVTARLDMWLLPFANVYGLFGYINGETEIDLDIRGITGGLPPIGLPSTFDSGNIDLNIDYNGTTVGGGITLAGGYKDFFGSLDANYTYSKVDVVDGKIKAYTISPRLGVLFDSAAIMGSFSFWVGTMYMHYKQTITDDVNLQEIDPRLPSLEIDFKIDIKNDQPWNFLFGGQWEITKRVHFMAEGGLGDRKQLITGLFFRF
jgi:hypothetical protein